MTKYSHKYISIGEFPINTIAFTIEYQGEKYGTFEYGISRSNLFRYLRGLVHTKHKLLKSLYVLHGEI